MSQSRHQEILDPVSQALIKAIHPIPYEKPCDINILHCWRYVKRQVKAGRTDIDAIVSEFFNVVDTQRCKCGRFWRD